MNKTIKIPLAFQMAKQKSTVAILCIVCVLFFMAAGCGRQESLPKEDEENSYYFYAYQGNDKFEKQYIKLNTQYISLSLKEPQLPADIAIRGFVASEFQCDNFDIWQYKGKPGTRRYWTELNIGKVLTPEKYFELLADIKQKNGDVIVGPFFNSFDAPEDTKGFGTGHFFNVKLKNAKDEALLEQMAEQTGIVILYQFDYMPLFYKMSITETSEINALECANIFFESGLFQYAEMQFMNDIEEGKTIFYIAD